MTPATCCSQEGITTFSQWLTGLAFGNPTLLQQLLEQPLDPPGQAAPVQAMPDAHLYETLLVRPTSMIRLVAAALKMAGSQVSIALLGP